jgi:hypothetical protein
MFSLPARIFDILQLSSTRDQIKHLTIKGTSFACDLIVFLDSSGRVQAHRRYTLASGQWNRFCFRVETRHGEVIISSPLHLMTSFVPSLVIYRSPLEI